MLDQTGAELICEGLQGAGIDLVFGIPGVHNLALYEAFRRARLRVITPCHEQGAAFMALGYARATGKPGVIVTVPGPGLTNALTGITEAYLDSIPLVALVTNVRFDLSQRYQIHQIEQDKLTAFVTREVIAIRKPGDIRDGLRRAFTHAVDYGEPGPVVVDIAADVLWTKDSVPTPITPPPATAADNDNSSSVMESVRRIESSTRVGMIVGHGASSARDETRELAEWLGAPVVTTHSGRGVLREDHPLLMRFAWQPGGIDALNTCLKQCDLILALGVKFSEHGTHSFALEVPTSLIHVDREPDVFGHNYTCLQSVHMDVSAYLQGLIAHKHRLGPRDSRRHEVEAMLAAIQTKVQANHREDTYCTIGTETYPASTFFAALRAAMPEDAILVTDAGHHQLLASQNFPVYRPNTLIIPVDYQAMGFGIPTAVGVALAQPTQKTVAVIGDGSFAVSGFELLTAVREQANLVILLFNNRAYGIIKDIQEEQFGVSTNAMLCNPDFRQLAASFGLHYAQPGGSLHTALAQLMKRRGPVLVEVGIRTKRRSGVGRLQRRLKSDVRQVVSSILSIRQQGGER
ncbi:MAG: thiamine pyrophosphate-binding protein [Chloroflexota bacterium]